ncbi:restriction endonuclease subunit S [Lautropia mirabilis]|uniref:restriction endonuclease subunit S n=1 Tax=Lautropia mirabilis TaxID=47671 RepID=UPI0028E93457|nr:restriction endonuclease subunit S [Lautropia mirabilis]
MSAETPLIDIRPDHWEIVQRILQEHVPNLEVWAFGSRAKWNAKAFSDLDLAIITDEPLPIDTSAALNEAFSESDLPWKVDVVDWASVGEKFKRLIERTKVVVQSPSSSSGGNDRQVREEIKENDGWSRVSLGEAFDINPPRHIKRGAFTPFVPMDAIPVNSRRPERMDRREYTGSGTRFRNGDTLVARITPCLENGKTAYISDLPDGVVAHGSTEYIVISGRKGVSDGLFGYYVARSPDFRDYAISRMEGTSGRQRVPVDAIEVYRINLPSLTEQQAIANILGTLDDKIELNRKQNETLEEMARALFKAWFVDFEPVRAKMEGRWKRGQSLPGMPAHLYDLFPDRMVESELGEIPEGWEVRSLDSIANYLNGLALQKYPPESEDEFLPVIKIAQLRSGDTHGAGRASARISPEYVVENGDVLFSWSGSLEVEVWSGGRGALNQHLFKVTSGLFPKWFYYFATRHHLPTFREIAAGKATTMGHIQRKHLTASKVVIPSLEGMNRIDSVIAPLFEKLTYNAKQSRVLVQLRDSLLPDLVSGDLRVQNPGRLLENMRRL